MAGNTTYMHRHTETIKNSPDVASFPVSTSSFFPHVVKKVGGTPGWFTHMNAAASYLQEVCMVMWYAVILPRNAEA